MWTWVSDKDNWTKYVLLFLNLSPLFWLPSLTFIWESSLQGSKRVVESRSVIRNAKNARGLGRDTAPFPKSCASYFRFARFNTFPLYYLRAWMTDRPADARAFSRPTSKATEKRPGSKLRKSGPIAMVAKNWACSFSVVLSDNLDNQIWNWIRWPTANIVVKVPTLFFLFFFFFLLYCEVLF